MPYPRQPAQWKQPAAVPARPHPELQPGYFAGTVWGVVQELKQHRGTLSVAELAPILGISTDVLHRMVRKGSIPTLVLPGCTVRRFDPASVLHWLAEHNPILHRIQKAS